MKYHSKVLLFGEHTVVKGSQALAMPLDKHFGTWQFATDSIETQKLQQKLPQFEEYLQTQALEEVLNLASFSKELDRGLYFESTIPTGYGMGSSGALCAAIFNRYKKQEITDLPSLKRLFGKMESYFHGSSSGMDPLVCYLNYPILFSKKEIKKVSLPTATPFELGAIFLLDTHIQRETAPFVNGFLERCTIPIYNEHCTEILAPLVNQAIAHYLAGNWQALYEAWATLSQFQFNYFDFMIPTSFKKVWKQGLVEPHFKLKICGAGGGGYLLGITKDFAATKESLSDYDLIQIG